MCLPLSDQAMSTFRPLVSRILVHHCNPGVPCRGWAWAAGFWHGTSLQGRESLALSTVRPTAPSRDRNLGRATTA